MHVVESLAEWAAPAVLGATLAWAGSRLGMSFAATTVGALAAFGAGWAVMRRTDADRLAGIATFEAAVLDADELLLTDEVLMLDDPLTEPAANSRVVRLFATEEPTPGQLVERIADFLGDNQRTVTEALENATAARRVDASDALHAALANIRASLR